MDTITIEINSDPDTGDRIEAEKVLLATGSSPWAAPIDGLDAIEYETSESILRRRELPESMIVFGGGYVALECGQILHRVGVDVTLLQRSDRLLSRMEGQLGREIKRCFEEEGFEVVTRNHFRRVRTSDVAADNGVSAEEHQVVVEIEVNGILRMFAAEELFVATGVRPNIDGIGLDRIGVEVDDTGAVAVNEHYRTANPDVYTAGDVIGEPMLETIAAKEGNHAVQNAFGAEGLTVDYRSVPKVVFTSPEIAAVGVTEREYMDERGTRSCRTVEMADLPKARAVGDTRGLLQVVKHHETDKIVGVHMVAPRAADMIPEATLAVKFGLTVDDIIDTIHPFPTFNEAFRRDTSTMSCCFE